MSLLPPGAGGAGGTGGVRVSVNTLMWGDEAAARALGDPFDIVVAADVIFERDERQKPRNDTNTSEPLHAANDAFDDTQVAGRNRSQSMLLSFN